MPRISLESDEGQEIIYRILKANDSIKCLQNSNIITGLYTFSSKSSIGFQLCESLCFARNKKSAKLILYNRRS